MAAPTAPVQNNSVQNNSAQNDPTTDATFNVLFVCRHNTARSLMAEAVLRKWGGDLFQTFSAGPEPQADANPIALDILQKAKVDTVGLAPKSWSLFAGPAAPRLDFVFIVCEDCCALPLPAWNGTPLVARWALPDPMSLDGTEVEKRALFNLVFGMIDRRTRILCALPPARLRRLTAGDLSAMATEPA